MAKYTEKDGTCFVEPNSVDEYLWQIWAIGYDYDGCGDNPKALKGLIDELVDYSKKARNLLYEGKLFSKEPIAGERPNDWKEVYE